MHIYALYAAKPQPFGPRSAPSAIVKSQVSQLTVHDTGTLEDEQGNKKLHGGPEKVLHQYSVEGYKMLADAYPDGDFSYGTIGENFLVEGMHDDNVYVGDIYRMGSITVQVSAPRAPCNKISHRFGIKNLDRFVGQQGITGWYFRVLESGPLLQHDAVKLIERPDNSVCIGALMRCMYDDSLKEEAARYAQMDVLDDEWRQKCLRRAR
ncbi:MOSC domain-containing protein [Salinimonas sp. HHU 13199]|uniref:MOSC domain-containing protein n=1 Tax=Salinimonas profundi TaxID=2729140 RepID=A0ABR8LJJ9_9ALTE|nr:MOSC domain-containing protein [Salinimonas profundi]MBD3586379.1 MOSC domain-containing protein [Salinimonas profundi]